MCSYSYVPSVYVEYGHLHNLRDRYCCCCCWHVLLLARRHTLRTRQQRTSTPYSYVASCTAVRVVSELRRDFNFEPTNTKKATRSSLTPWPTRSKTALCMPLYVNRSHLPPSSSMVYNSTAVPLLLAINISQYSTRRAHALYHTFANSTDGLCRSKRSQEKRRVRPLRDRLAAIEQTVSQLLQGRGALLSVRNGHDLSSVAVHQPSLLVRSCLLCLLFSGFHTPWQALLPRVSPIFSEDKKSPKIPLPSDWSPVDVAYYKQCTRSAV